MLIDLNFCFCLELLKCAKGIPIDSDCNLNNVIKRYSRPILLQVSIP